LKRILARILKILARILKILARIFFKAIRLIHQNHLSWSSKNKQLLHFHITSTVFSYISIRTVPKRLMCSAKNKQKHPKIACLIGLKQCLIQKMKQMKQMQNGDDEQKSASDK